MKYIWILLLAGVAMGQSVQRHLHWDYPADELEGTTFRVHQSTNIATPLDQWAVTAILTQMVTIETNVPVTIQLPVTFFSVSASNVIGGPVFSEVLRAKLPSPGTKPRLR